MMTTTRKRKEQMEWEETERGRKQKKNIGAAKKTNSNETPQKRRMNEKGEIQTHKKKE